MKLLIISNTTKNNYDAVKNKLKDHDVHFADTGDYQEKIKDFEYVIAGREGYSPHILENAGNLKIISRCGHGTDAINKTYCKEHGIKVLDARGALDDTMADVTIGYMIMALRKLKEIDEGTRKEGWKPILGNNLTGKTVGIIGLGGIGKAVAKRLQGFKTNTIFYDIDPAKQNDYPYANFVSRDEIFEESDIITLHCDLNSSSHHIINSVTLDAMKKKPVVINTARGNMIFLPSLKEAIDNEKISYAVLDVYPEEPLPKEHEIRNTKNIIFGSHSTCYSVEGQRALARKAVTNLIRSIK